MQMKWLLMSMAAVAALAAGPASAADIPVKAPPRSMVANWTGCHIGGQVGFMRSEDTRLVFGQTALTDASDQFRFGGALAGGQIGCDWQTTSNLVLGIEGDIAWTSAGETVLDIANTTYNFRFEQDWLATVRGRIGITLGSSGLLYLTGGGAWANLSLAGYQPLTPFASASQELTKSGWTVGTGYEVKLTPAWSFKTEYLYVDLGTPSFFSPGAPVIGSEMHLRLREHIFRAGLNWHWNWGR